MLVTADTLDEAEDKAIRLGIEDEGSSVNEAGETIESTLLHSVDVKEVVDGEIFDGATLYVRHFTDYEAYGALEPVVYAEAEAVEEEEASETPPAPPPRSQFPPLRRRAAPLQRAPGLRHRAHGPEPSGVRAPAPVRRALPARPAPTAAPDPAAPAPASAERNR